VKIKLDQNLGERGRETFAAAGHDVCTTSAQGLRVRIHKGGED
jgi:hypothetical protein